MGLGIDVDLARRRAKDASPTGYAALTSQPLSVEAADTARIDSAYLRRDGRGTLYRIHGTLEPDTIGQAVSSGCIRMIDQDAIALYARVETGTQVVELPPGTATEAAGDTGDAMADAR